MTQKLTNTIAAGCLDCSWRTGWRPLHTEESKTVTEAKAHTKATGHEVNIRRWE